MLAITKPKPFSINKSYLVYLVFTRQAKGEVKWTLMVSQLFPKAGAVGVQDWASPISRILFSAALSLLPTEVCPHLPGENWDLQVEIIPLGPPAAQ